MEMGRQDGCSCDALKEAPEVVQQVIAVPLPLNLTFNFINILRYQNKNLKLNN
jgi:hypothetical protein